MKDELEQRIQFLKIELDKSAGNHNAILGRLAESQELLASIIQKELHSNDVLPVEEGVQLEVPCAAANEGGQPDAA